MDSTLHIKLDTINKSAKNKKRIYRDILSSSENIKNIIKNRKKLYNKQQNYEIGNKPDIPKINVILRKSPVSNEKKEIKKEIKGKSKQKKVQFYFNPEKEKEHPKEKDKPKQPKTKKVPLEFFKPKFKQKYQNQKIKNFFNNQKKIEVRIFTKEDIVRFIKTLMALSNKDQNIQVHRYIRKLNKYQTIQILFAVKLIKRKSNAPEKMLKNILFNYFTSSINIKKY